MIRWYIVPLIGSPRRPKYIADYESLDWRLMDCGLHPLALVWADVDSAQHDVIAANDDVYAFPPDIDQPIGGDLDYVIAGIEAFGIPAHNLSATDTHRAALRAVAGIFQFAQRYHGLTGQMLLDAGMDTAWSTWPYEYQVKFMFAAWRMGAQIEQPEPHETLRDLVVEMANIWETREILIGGISI